MEHPLIKRIFAALLVASTVLWPSAAFAMPGLIEAITFLSLAAQAGAIGTGIAAVASVYAGTLIGIGASVGLSYLASSMLRTGGPQRKPEDVQQSFRQATAPRMRHYGRVKVSGPWVFAEAKAGAFHKVLALGQGPVDAIEEYWLDDTHVTLNGNNDVVEAPWYAAASNYHTAHIETRLGASTETTYSSLGAVFPEWTAAHRGDGVASLYALQRASGQSAYFKRFPNGINTSYRVVLRGAKVENPLTGSVEWSDNAAAIIRDYITHADGMRLPAAIVNTPLAQAGWAKAFARSAEAIDLAGGGTEPRYRLWGSYGLDERPADVIGRMLACCDGRLKPTPDGGLTVDIGEWSEPSVILGPDAITGFTELGRGHDIMSTANTIRATFLNLEQDYQASDADAWVNAADVSDRGEMVQSLAFNMAPSHSHCRRLMKLASYRANPTWTGRFQLNLRGLAAFGERFVRIRYPLFGINSVFEVQKFDFVIGEGGILTGVTLDVISLPQSAYQWDADQEEGDAPVSDETDVDDAIPVPPAPTVDILTGPVASLAFSPSNNPLLSYQARWKPTAGSTWTTSSVLANSASTYTTGSLTAATAYEFQLRFVTEKGAEGAWGASAVASTA